MYVLYESLEKSSLGHMIVEVIDLGVRGDEFKKVCEIRHSKLIKEI
jgi:hypothetical protein